jgi:hypothetical protein
MCSPLKIPEERGATFRFILSGLVLIVVGCVIYGTTAGIGDGKIEVPKRNGPSSIFYRSENPKGFWTALVFLSGVSALLSYASIAEITYTIKRRKREKEFRKNHERTSTSGVAGGSGQGG